MGRLITDDAIAIATIFQEAAGEPYIDKVMVAEVILNRTKAGYRTDGTVTGTCLWPMQFSGWNAHDPTPQYRERIESAKIDDRKPVVQECMRAWEEAKNGSNRVKGAMDYYNPAIAAPDWAKDAEILARGRRHVFVRPKGQG